MSLLLSRETEPQTTNKMKHKLLSATAVILLSNIALSVKAQKYHVTNVECQRVTIDSRYAPDKDAEEFLAPYKAVIDSAMSPVVGTSAKYMTSHAPESELSNLLADIMVWCGTKYSEHPDVGIYNLGGIRASLPKGTITFGDINDIAPFENKICFITLNGSQMKTLFQQMSYRGAGVSRGIEAIYNKEYELQSLKLNGTEIDDEASYRVATIDYLIQGNDGFKELRNGKDIITPKDNLSNTRFLIADFFRDQTAQGKVIDSNIEGRVVILE